MARLDTPCAELETCPKCNGLVDPDDMLDLPMRARRCVACNEAVLAFNPNPDADAEGYFYAGEPDAEAQLLGAELGGEQCGSCGLSSYRLERRADGALVAVCCGEHRDGDWLAGCGAEWRVRRMPSYRVIF